MPLPAPPGLSSPLPASMLPPSLPPSFGAPQDALCRVSDNAFDPEDNANIPTQAYELPDGQVGCHF